ncbi:MFS transporter [Pelagibacterium limicola]|uniref:MFS transporter n=1 Tax=Pelagibacterium limicola TaxID=2791022 RepID=UPI0018AFD9DF|nr:MFS transporter [Pelagibacterium limicola]
MKRIVPITLAVALFMENMDATVIATSLPAIAADIGTSPVALKLAFTAYFVALAIFIPVSSWVADRYGAKRVFCFAIIVFLLGSVACAFAGSLTEFVLARFFKGMGGAMMTPLARLILFRSVPRSDLIGAMTWLTVPALVAPTLGPPVGGFITTFVSWHWIFLINVPIGLAGLGLIVKCLPELEPGPPRRLDVTGFVLLGLAFSGVIFGLSLVSLPVLPVWVAIVTGGTGIAAIILYGFHVRRTDEPLLDPRIFREPAFRATIFGTALFLIGVGAMPFLLPLMLQLGFGMTPFETGLVTFMGAFGAMLTKFFTRQLYAGIGFRNALMGATILSTLGMGVLGFVTPQTSTALIVVLLFVTGLVRSAYFTGQHALGLSQIAEDEAGQATAISTVTRPVATALGVALAGFVLEVSAHGDALSLGDFHVAFFVVSGVSALAVVPFILLPKDAGSVVSGHLSSRSREEALKRSRERGNDGQSPRF